MSSPYMIKIIDAPNQPKGSVALLVSGQNLSTGQIRARFKRWGHKKPYLSINGWQVAEAWLDLDVVVDPITPDEFKVILLPHISYALEEGSNYILTLMSSDSVFFDQPIRWSITHRTLMGSPSNPVVTHPTSVPNITDGQDDMDCWRAALTANTKESITQFLLNFPNSRFREEAITALKAFLPEYILVRTTWVSNGRAAPYGIDTCVFMLTNLSKVRSDLDFISSFATDQETESDLRISSCQSIKNLGSENTNDPDSKIESIIIELPLVPMDIQQLALSLSMDTRVDMNIGFEAINAKVEIINAKNEELLKTLFLAERKFGINGRVIIILQRSEKEWILSEVDDFFNDGILGVCRRFGVSTT